MVSFSGRATSKIPTLSDNNSTAPANIWSILNMPLVHWYLHQCINLRDIRTKETVSMVEWENSKFIHQK